MAQDRLQRAKERFSDSMEAVGEQYDRIREDMRFSNPAMPQQWSAQAIELRSGRPMLTFNHCPKYIRQVANDGRAAVPSIQVTPADAYAHAKAAEAINGRLRHIEYVSKAKVAYTTALSLAANCGLGWLRVIPEVIAAETNVQEPRILRVHDPLSCVLDPDAVEPDGCDSEFGFVLSPMTRKKFQRAYPKASATHGWDDEYRLWTRGDEIIVAEYFEIIRTKRNRIVIRTPDGETMTLTEDEYWQVAGATGVKPEVVETFTSDDKSVKWSKMTGAEQLEETDFPATYVPIIPVVGDEQWVDGKRFLCGLTRQLMDGQRMHNAEMSAYTETILAQPKAPFMVPVRAMDENLQAKWQKLNTGNPAFLLYHDMDEDGQAVSAPSRLSPPQLPTAFANGANMAISEMDASVGMFRAAYGDQGRAISGKAKVEDRRQSDTGTYHYHDNLSRAVEHLGRIVFEMDRALTDTARTVRTMSVDDKPGYVRFDPDMQAPVKMRGNEVEAVNPRIGEYEMRVKTGPAFVTQAEEAAAELGEMFRGAPELLPVLGPTWVRLRNVPYADKLAKLLLAMAPPAVQAIENEDEKDQPIPPQAKQAISQLEQQIQELSSALEKAAEEADKTSVDREKARVEREKVEADMLIRGYQAVTDRLKVAPPMTPEQMVALVQKTVAEALSIPPGEEPDETTMSEPMDIEQMPDMGEPFQHPAAVGEATPIPFEPDNGELP